MAQNGSKWSEIGPHWQNRSDQAFLRSFRANFGHFGHRPFLAYLTLFGHDWPGLADKKRRRRKTKRDIPLTSCRLAIGPSVCTWVQDFVRAAAETVSFVWSKMAPEKCRIACTAEPCSKFYNKPLVHFALIWLGYMCYYLHSNFGEKSLYNLVLDTLHCRKGSPSGLEWCWG